MEEEKKKRKIFKKLKNKYRLVILNDASFEERFSYRLSTLNIVTLLISGAVLIMLTVSLVIVFTPLREYIPGYTDVSLRQDLTNMVLKSDSLERKLQQNNIYLENITAILKGEEPSLKDTVIKEVPVSGESLDPSKKSLEDSLLRDYVEREDFYSLNASSESTAPSPTKLYFFTPLKGTLTEEYNLAQKHYGVDIVAPKNEAVKATLDGTVIFAEWTVETGYVIQLQHKNNLSSIYKHNSVLLKSTGDVIKAGEAIAIVGNSGELTSGPHLHFELWQDGVSLNPVNYINFN